MPLLRVDHSVPVIVVDPAAQRALPLLASYPQLIGREAHWGLVPCRRLRVDQAFTAQITELVNAECDMCSRDGVI